ncbi:MAG: hypothetical protein EA377_03485 [Phycisphaerales bacterium]|nr:MAG: hypothetical protein EA377_03485 [Phycisphaerales bacterium]
MKNPVVVGGLLLAVIIFIALWLLFAQSSALPSVSVSDVRQPETIVLEQETGDDSVRWLTVRGSGVLNGEATISWVVDGQPYRVEQLNDEIDFEWGRDWHSRTAEIRYEPGEVRSGTVSLHYKFHR